MIPKIIHYCWFGKGSKSKLMKRCINSWKTMCPDFNIIEWNEENFDVTSNLYTKYCYEEKKWAYLSDFIRLKVVYEYGGVYLDTDVEVIKDLSSLLKYSAFFGFENCEYVNTGLGFGAEKENSIVLQMINEYKNLIYDQGNRIELIGCPILNSISIKNYGFTMNGMGQNINNIQLLPAEYLNPYDDTTGRMNKTENTYSIHWYSKSALSKRTIFKSKITKPFHRVFGVNCFDIFKK